MTAADLLIYVLMGVFFTVVIVKSLITSAAPAKKAETAEETESPAVILPEIPEPAPAVTLPVIPPAVAPASVTAATPGAAAPEPLVPAVPRKGLGQRLVLAMTFMGRLVRLLAVRVPRQAGRSLQERRQGRRMAANRALQQLQPALKVSRQLYTGGETIRVATTYRVYAEGEWQTCTRVVEPVSNKSYWLAGDPAEDPSIEGFLEDRRRLAHLSTAVH